MDYYVPPGKNDDYGLSKMLILNEIYVPASGPVQTIADINFVKF